MSKANPRPSAPRVPAWVPTDAAETEASSLTAPAKTCASCGRPLDGHRPEAVYCTGRCRTAAYRARKAAQPGPTPALVDDTSHPNGTRDVERVTSRAGSEYAAAQTFWRKVGEIRRGRPGIRRS
jgi:hypothetical protein